MMDTDCLTSTQRSILDCLKSGMTLDEATQMSVDLYSEEQYQRGFKSRVGVLASSLERQHWRWVKGCSVYGQRFKSEAVESRVNRMNIERGVRLYKVGFILHMLLHGVSIERACQKVGMSRTTFQSWRGEDEWISSRVLQIWSCESSQSVFSREDLIHITILEVGLCLHFLRKEESWCSDSLLFDRVSQLMLMMDSSGRVSFIDPLHIHIHRSLNSSVDDGSPVSDDGSLLLIHPNTISIYDLSG